MSTATAPPFGVEEEFLVVDPVTRSVTPQADTVVRAARARLGAGVSGEITKLHVETRTEPTTSVTELLAQLTEARRVVAGCAENAGLRLVATGTPVLPGPVPPPVTEGPRQDRGTATFRGLHDELAICALHVHVELPDRERALLISNHLRGHLPLLLALTANSPYWDGRDSGYASWRTMIWPRWPVAGPPPTFTSLAHYEQIVETLLTAGATVDTGTIFWDIRPSVQHPTLEIRVADVPVTAPESALYAALVRAMVVRAAEAVDRGEEAADIPAELLRVAYWRAARDGLEGDVLDLRTGRPAPTRDVVADLVRSLLPVLRDHGDDKLVLAELDRLLDAGSGAARQRAAVARRGRLTDAVDYLIEATALGAVAPTPNESTFT
ncbi:carboxylate-amine ligase [Micromonospora radicis]|uniref:Putative glutamate--cysteine ligase 2 n=1 Tax=Micromonospora radicis TaxID=1894971 RepID=A0A418MZE8_9ACTN|nr:glutamate--cysteine ligase [Micromonospora radicis]RIV40334.1 YbdK family carboxylate-amine ligase [Micromonospora radicis]